VSHNCPVSVCPAVLDDDDKFLCWPHWSIVPAPLQRLVYAAYRRGHGRGTQKLADAQQAALAAVEDQLSSLTDPQTPSTERNPVGT
jgi:hypothetical protein